VKKFTMFILTTAVAASISSTALAAEIPRESAPANATEESIVITENLISGILDEVQNGLGYQPAWCKAVKSKSFGGFPSFALSLQKHKRPVNYHKPLSLLLLNLHCRYAPFPLLHRQCQA